MKNLLTRFPLSAFLVLFLFKANVGLGQTIVYHCQPSTGIVKRVVSDSVWVSNVLTGEVTIKLPFTSVQVEPGSVFVDNYWYQAAMQDLSMCQDVKNHYIGDTGVKVYCGPHAQGTLNGELKEYCGNSNGEICSVKKGNVTTFISDGVRWY